MCWPALDLCDNQEPSGQIVHLQPRHLRVYFPRLPFSPTFLTNLTTMDFIQNVRKRMPSTQNIPTLDGLSKSAEKISPRSIAFFRRRIRLKDNSRISIPLGFVLLFPCIVLILILVLVVRHPSSPGRILVPAGAPPSIRYVDLRSLDPALRD